ncbi:type II secretion system minor pseudopilin GspI [Parvularcula sp. LCG005]|uniref:type II secretion system minor pseudopilin GspI n=1 Tax=Parvularcula sp. LCG005 TaxID=3078805 RepID=UPI0029420184|nr:type II secretion system minor pseudopilin GspI [Parvularcula sp. LCG005]WOI54372.1 type II secretion system minor pseudopilin GspI [Parvularcula sp. LCG005]
MANNNQRGMTLVEVLVALLVLGSAVATMLSLLSVHTRNTIALQDRAMARIVAENAMVEVVSADRIRRRIEGGAVEDLGGQSFTWAVERTPTPYDGLDNVTVTVRHADGDRVLAILSTVRPQ